MITGAEREHRGELGPLGGKWGVFVTPLEEEELLVIICPGWHNNSVPGRGASSSARRRLA